LQIRNISPCEAAEILKRRFVPYGQDFIFPYDIDTSECEDFGGIRCDCNLHAKGRNVAHLDRFDPRRDLLRHLEEDVGIPVGPIIFFGALAVLVWAVRSGSRKE